jgi:rhodanese-related sulfurtransferase
MAASPTFDPENFERQAVEVAGILRALANERRLMILCTLVECGESNVGTLATAVGLSQSALSQRQEQIKQSKELTMSLPSIKPAEALRFLDGGALLIDIREADEHARQKIPGARHMPLSKLDDAEIAAHHGKPVIFHCKSCARTQANASRLAAKLDETCEAFVLEGGLDAWRKAGLPVVSD